MSRLRKNICGAGPKIAHHTDCMRVAKSGFKYAGRRLKIATHDLHKFEICEFTPSTAPKALPHIKLLFISTYQNKI